MTTEADSPNAGARVAFLVGAAVGVLTVIALVASGAVDLDAWFERRWPGPLWTSVFPIAASVVVVGVLSARMASRIGWGITAAMVPLGAGTMVMRLVDPVPLWAAALRGLGLAAVVAVLLVGALSYAREYRELESFLFTQATSVAFFVTIVGGGAYAALEAFVDMPSLSYVWVPVFGLCAWGLAAFVLKRKMT